MKTQRAFAKLIRCISVFGVLCVLVAAFLVSCTPWKTPEPVHEPPLNYVDENSRQYYDPVPAGDNLTPEQADALADFSIRLVQALSDQEGNLTVSPLSLAYALGMIENGASEETLAQLEEVLGLSAEDLREIYAAFPQSDNISVANALWVRDDCPVDPQFLEDSRTFYEAEVFNAPFDDQAIHQINAWANEQTDGMIPSVLHQFPENAVMILLDAIAFSAKWITPYDPAFTTDGTFVAASGEEQTAHYMRSTEYAYIETECATGFIKSYEGGDYEFVALLPNEGYDPRGVITAMSGTELRNVLTHTEYIPVHTVMPRFSNEMQLDLTDPLQNMGADAAFSEQEGFDRMLSTDCESSQPLNLDSITQNTFIEVDEYGTRAAAVTVEILCGSAAIDDYREVTLNRPFAYMIVEA